MADFVVDVHVVPGAARDEFVGLHGGKLKIKVAARPIKGQSNARLIKILSARLGVPKSAMEILKGSASRGKRIKIQGITESDFKNCFAEFYGGAD
ncbi:DUF167 domain-containing protein [Candidatus Mycalebacterium sp.]